MCLRLHKVWKIAPCFDAAPYAWNVPRIQPAWGVFFSFHRPLYGIFKFVHLGLHYIAWIQPVGILTTTSRLLDSLMYLKYDPIWRCVDDFYIKLRYFVVFDFLVSRTKLERYVLTGRVSRNWRYMGILCDGLVIKQLNERGTRAARWIDTTERGTQQWKIFRAIFPANSLRTSAPHNMMQLESQNVVESKGHLKSCRHWAETPFGMYEDIFQKYGLGNFGDSIFKTSRQPNIQEQFSFLCLQSEH